MAITANKKFWTEFIDIYHSLPSLWNTKDENYNNRESRSMAWNKLVEKLQDVEPDANQDSVKRKINTFRSNFNREVRKIRQTQKEQPAAEVYNPTLWYFDQLSFLLNQEKCNGNGVSIDGHYDEEMTLMGLTATKSEIMEENETMMGESTISQEETTTVVNDQNCSFEKLNSNKSMTRLGVKRNNRDKILEPEPMAVPKPIIEFPPVIEVIQTESSPALQPTEPQTLGLQENPVKPLENIEEKSNELESSSSPNCRKLRSNCKKSKLRLKSLDPYNRTFVRNNIVSSSMLTDEAAIYGQSWACGFRKLSPQQKLFAKKAIDEILILGQLKVLKLNTVTMNVANSLEVPSDEG